VVVRSRFEEVAVRTQNRGIAFIRFLKPFLFRPSVDSQQSPVDPGQKRLGRGSSFAKPADLSTEVHL